MHRSGCPRSRALPHQISFFLRRNISRCLSDHYPAACSATSFSVSREGFTLSKRNRRQSRCPPEQLVYTTFSSHGQPLEKQYFQHLEITFKCCLINRPFIPLAMFHFSRPLEKLEFVRSSNSHAKPGLIYHSSTLYFSPQGMLFHTNSNVEMDEHS